MNIIVTGASRGIGYELAKKFAIEKGNRVVAVSRNLERLQELEQECLEEFSGSMIRIISFDLMDMKGIETVLRQRIIEVFDSVDLIVNNAGFLVNKPAARITTDEADRMLQVNVLAPLVLVRSLFSLLEKPELSHVLNIGSMAGVPGVKKFPGLSVYSASKAAVHVLTECLAEEYADTGIRFNALALGSVQTEMLAEAFPGLKAPLKASEMAEFVYDFAVRGHRYFNGKVLPVSVSTP
jgi:short-subunit dehydrogenase